MLALAGVGCVALPPAEAVAAPSELPSELGYNYGKQESPRVLAMGGALRALSNSTEALYENPANMAATRVYHFAGVVQLVPQADRQSYGATAVDSVVSKSRLAGGVTGVWSQQDSDGLDRKFRDLRLGFAYPFSDNFMFGASGRYFTLSQEGPLRLKDGSSHPLRAGTGLVNTEIGKDITFDAGVTLKPIPELAFAVVGNNLTDPGHGFLPLQFGAGIGYGNQDFSLEVDAVNDFTPYGATTRVLMGGGELLIADHYSARGGYRYDEALDVSAVSGGIGYVNREFSVDLSVRRSLGELAATWIAFGFKYHLESTGLTGGGY